MLVEIRKLDQCDYFYNSAFKNKKKTEGNENIIVITPEMMSGSDPNLSLVLDSIMHEDVIKIYCLQNSKFDFNNICDYLIKILSSLKLAEVENKITIYLVSENFEFYYKKLYSRLYIKEPKEQNINFNINKIYYFCLLRTLFNYKLLYTASSMMEKIKSSLMK